jgi:hypothetical protein
MPIIMCGYCEYIHIGIILYNDDVIKAYTEMQKHEREEHISEEEMNYLIKKEGL